MKLRQKTNNDLDDMKNRDTNTHGLIPFHYQVACIRKCRAKSDESNFRYSDCEIRNRDAYLKDVCKCEYVEILRIYPK